MLRAMRLALGAAVVLSGGVLLAQPKDAQADNFFPLKKGAEWTYKVGDNEVKVKVVKSETKNKEEHFQVDTIVGKEPKTTEWYVVKSDGVYRSQVKDDKLDPYIKVLPLPVKDGATWDVNSKLGTQTIKGQMKLTKVKDPVMTPAGKFEAFLAEGKDMDVAGAKTTVRIWFAKDRGIVKEEFILQGGETLQLELKDYTEGK